MEHERVEPPVSCIPPDWKRFGGNEFEKRPDGRICHLQAAIKKRAEKPALKCFVEVLQPAAATARFAMTFTRLARYLASP